MSITQSRLFCRRWNNDDDYETTATDWFNRAFLDAVETALSALEEIAQASRLLVHFNNDDDLVRTGAMPQPESLARSLENFLGRAQPD